MAETQDDGEAQRRRNRPEPEYLVTFVPFAPSRRRGDARPANRKFSPVTAARNIIIDAAVFIIIIIMKV